MKIYVLSRFFNNQIFLSHVIADSKIEAIKKSGYLDDLPDFDTLDEIYDYAYNCDSVIEVMESPCIPQL